MHRTHTSHATLAIEPIPNLCYHALLTRNRAALSRQPTLDPPPNTDGDPHRSHGNLPVRVFWKRNIMWAGARAYFSKGAKVSTIPRPQNPTSPAMPRHVADYPPGSPIYTFVAHDGLNTHIDAEALRLHCITTAQPTYLTPTDRKVALNFLTNNIVSQERLLQLVERLVTGRTPFTPIIYCINGPGDFNAPNNAPDVMLVDGHHRYVLANAVGSMIEAYMIPESLWRTFEIHGLPTLTQDQLSRIPIKPRNY